MHEPEMAFTICLSPNGQLIRGSETTGDSSSHVSLKPGCPHGCRMIGIHHTHPHGVALLSKTDIQSAKNQHIPWMCVTVPEKNVTRCYRIKP